METVVLSETINFSTSSLQTSQSGGIKKDPCNANTRSHPLRNKLAIPEGHRLGLLPFISQQDKEQKFHCCVCHVYKINHTVQPLLPALCTGGNQTACTDHHWCVFEGTYRESSRAATFLEFCVGNWAARLFTALAASVCMMGHKGCPWASPQGQVLLSLRGFHSIFECPHVLNTELYSVIPRSYSKKALFNISGEVDYNIS